jgi:hypothetical protein
MAEKIGVEFEIGAGAPHLLEIAVFLRAVDRFPEVSDFVPALDQEPREALSLA